METIPLYLMLFFTTKGIDQRLEEVASVVGHIPEYWGLSVEERAALAKMVANPEGKGRRHVLYRVDVEADETTIERYKALLDELASRAKHMAYSNGLKCVDGVGGSKADLEKRASELLAERNSLPAQSSSSGTAQAGGV